MKELKYVVLVAIMIVSFSCAATKEQPPTPDQPDKENSESVKTPDVTKEASPNQSPASNTCPPTINGDAKVLSSQTFKMDFEPFKGGCFVTTYSSGDENRPAGSVIAIYKSGEKAFEFDTRYHKDQAVCRVEAVSFEDANNDGRSDISVVGKCDTKSGEIQGNEIHFNTGTGFRTSTAANDKLENISKIKEVVEFARTNPDIFN